MKTQSILFASGIILLVVLAIGATFLPRAVKNPNEDPITSFTDCVNAGNPIMESSPRMCRDKQGNTFTEELPARNEPIISTSTAQKPESLIIVSSPLPGAHIQSPLTATGTARGYWYFEASFPVTLRDANGAILAQGIAQAQGDWMTEDFVPFTATLNWSTSTTASGVIEFRRDNPSGLPENDAMISLPVTF